jgi:hypothetical protein
MKQDNDYKTLIRKIGICLLDPDIYYRVYGTEKPRPYHKFKTISGLNFNLGTMRCNFAGHGRHSKMYCIARLITNAQQGQIIDHINRNPLDNRRCNLRKVTSRQNNINRTCRNNTGFFGVSSWKRDGHAYINAYFKAGKNHMFNASDYPFNRILCAFAHDKFVLQAGDQKYAPLNFPCWKFEPFRSFLIEADLYDCKEKGYRKKTNGQNPEAKISAEKNTCG